MHGDFRHGNLIIGPDGVRAVLDWELAHIGDPMEDLGWICVNSWRFGEIDKPVGGFGRARNCSRATRRPAARTTRTRKVLGNVRHAEMGHHVLGIMQRSAKVRIERWNAPRSAGAHRKRKSIVAAASPTGEITCRTNRHPPN